MREANPDAAVSAAARPALGAQTFLQRQVCSSPACALTSLTPAPGRGRLGAGRNHPIRRLTRRKGGKKARSIREEKSERCAPEPGFPYWRRGACTDPAPDQPPGAVTRPGRLLCAPDTGRHCKSSPSRPGCPPASAVRTLSCRRRALCTVRLRGRRKSTCHFLNCLQLVPLTGLGQAASARRRRRRAARPRLRELGGAVRAASRPGRPACRYEVQCAQPPVGGDWEGGSRRASGRAAGCPANPHRAPLTPGGPARGK